jgi:hypothetical protein
MLALRFHPNADGKNVKSAQIFTFSQLYVFLEFA